MMDTKIKQDQICIGKNIREIRISKGMGQTELVRKIQLRGITMTRETLVKIERGVQHIYATQLKAIKELLDTSFDELLNIDTMEMHGVGEVTMEFKAFQLIIGNQIPTTNEILSIVVYGESIYRSATDNSIVREA